MKVFFPSVCVFAVPKIFIEYFSIAELKFSFKRIPSELFASHWIYFVCMFVLFEVVGLYIVINGFFMRREFLNLSRRIFVYVSEFVVLLVASALLITDKVEGKSLAGSNMIGPGNMEAALKGYRVLVGNWPVFDVLSVMHIVFTTGSVVYALSAVSNYAACTIFERRYFDKPDQIERRRDAYYRTLYCSTALLTVGVLQLAAWLALPAENILESETYTKLITALTIYLSMLFTLIAVVSAALSALSFNESLLKYTSDPVIIQKYKISLFDRTMIASVFMPAVVGYLLKVVPLMFG